MPPKSKKRVESDQGGLSSNPFAGLGDKLGNVPEGEAPQAVAKPAPPVAADPVDKRWSQKIVVRREKKGRGGKTATVIEGITASPSELERLAKTLRKSLGCGGHVEGSTIVLGGAQGPAVKAWLEAQGATRVVLGN